MTLYKRHILAVLFMVFAVCLSAASAEAFWLWSADTNEWQDPQGLAKDTPDRQFAHAKKFFDEGNYGRAYEEFEKITKHFSETPHAANAQFHMGLCREKQDNIIKAAEEFQILVDRYPYSEYTDEAIQHEFVIAEDMMEGKKAKFLGVDLLPVMDQAAGIYRHVVRSAPFGPYGARAQYRLGHAYLKMSELDQAEIAFRKVIDEYPESEYAAEAKYQIARVTYRQSQDQEYHMAKTEQAIDTFEGFAKTHPKSELAYEANAMISELRSKKAKGIYEIAVFYEERGRFPSARVYYQDVIDQFPDTPSAKEARARLQSIEGLDVAEPRGADRELGEMSKQGIAAIGKMPGKLFGIMAPADKDNEESSGAGEGKESEPETESGDGPKEGGGGLLGGIAQTTDFLINNVLLGKADDKEVGFEDDE